MEITVGIVDDHNVVINGVQNMLYDFPNIKITDVYSNGESLLAGLKKRQPDVLLLDIQLPDINGDDLTEKISNTYPNISILAMTGFDTSYYVKSMLQKGALGYLLKNTSASILVEAIETVYNRNRFVDPSLRQQLIDDMIMNKKQEFEQVMLTRREKEILKLIMEECTSPEIAKKLFLSVNTIENHRASLLQKLHVKNTAGLVKVALQRKLI